MAPNSCCSLLPFSELGACGTEDLRAAFGAGGCPLPAQLDPHISPCSQQALPWADFVFVALGVTPGRDLAVRAERGWGISGSRAVRCPAGQAAALGGFQHADSVWVCAGVHFQNQIPAP